MTTDQPRDLIYAEPRESVSRFVFDEDVARVFPDMIRRSVPGYATVLNMLPVLASRYVQPGTHCYDLGCSLGAASVAMQKGIRTPDCRILAIDNSLEMLEEAAKHLNEKVKDTPIQLICADLVDVGIQNASMVVLNFTLQFVPPKRRLGALQRIRDGLVPGGILVISEKISFSDSVQESMQIEMHHAFKRANGYGELEISQKRSALEQVLIPETLEQHLQRLDRAGFSHAGLWFQCFNFVSLVARR